MAEKKWGLGTEENKGNSNKLLFIGTGIIAFGIFVGIMLMLFFGNVNMPFQKCVAVVNIDGEISSQGAPATLFNEGTPSSSDIAATIKSLDDRDDVKAVVVKINSPGGGVVASEEIYRSLKNLSKPKVTYIYEMAASGGYYSAMGTDYIVAEPNALTGSIGVIAMTADFTGLMEKIGVNISMIKSADHKDFLSEFKATDPEEVKIMQAIINETYSEFVRVVKENRKTKIAESNYAMVTDGRIFSGRQALQYGLVDQLGDKQTAINKAAEMANISTEDVNICEIKYASGSSSNGLFSDLSRSIATLFYANQASKDGLYMK